MEWASRDLKRIRLQASMSASSSLQSAITIFTSLKRLTHFLKLSLSCCCTYTSNALFFVRILAPTKLVKKDRLRSSQEVMDLLGSHLNQRSALLDKLESNSHTWYVRGCHSRIHEENFSKCESVADAVIIENEWHFEPLEELRLNHFSGEGVIGSQHDVFSEIFSCSLEEIYVFAQFTDNRAKGTKPTRCGAINSYGHIPAIFTEVPLAYGTWWALSLCLKIPPSWSNMLQFSGF